MNWGIYCRISSDGTGEGEGVHRQEQACREFAQANNLTVVEVYVDNDISAYGGKARPAYERMLEDLQGGKIHGVICWHVDRLYRRSVDLERLAEIVEKVGAQVRTIKAGDLDLNTASGRLMARMVATISAYEVDHQIERMVAGHADRAQRGIHRGRVPYGYLRRPGGENIEINPAEAPGVRFAVERILAGDSLISVTRKLNERGFKPRKSAKWSRRSLRNMVTSPTIAGLSIYRGEVVGQGKWEPIISEADHHAVKAIVEDPQRRTSRQGHERRWQGAGVYRCGVCGAPLRVRRAKSPSYVCPECSGISRDLKKVDAFIDEVVLGYLDREDNRLRLVAYNEDDGNLSELIAERAQLVERKAQLGTLFAQGVVDQMQLIRGNKELELSIAKIDKRLESAREVDPVGDLLLSGDDLRQRWNDLSADKRAEILKLLVQVTILPGQKCGRAPFDLSLIKIDWKE